MKETIEIQQLIEFFKENENNIYKFAYSYVKNEDTALDIVHEAIIKAMQKSDTLKESKYLKTWFYRILINECLEVLRKTKKISFFEDIGNYEDLEQIDEFVNKNEYIDLYDAIEELPINLKTIIMLRYFEDMQLEEIAQITRTNLSTIKSRLYKALKILKIDLKGKIVMNKSKYNKIEIPEQLTSVVYDAIEKGINKQKQKSTMYKKIIGIAAMVLIAFVIPLNTIPAYAKTMQEIPVIGEICKIFTFKEYHFEDEIKYIDAKIPQLSDTGKTDLENRVNKEINKTINEELESSKKIAKEYYDAFIATGGKPEDFTPVGINIDYEKKCITEKCVSFIITKSETYPSAYFNQYFYNIDMETGRYFTLKDWLGNDYKKIAVKSIKDTISNWSEEKKALLWKEINLEDLINENTNFYINDKGQSVIVFEKYEVAVGSAGIIEFPINI